MLLGDATYLPTLADLRNICHCHMLEGSANPELIFLNSIRDPARKKIEGEIRVQEVLQRRSRVI